MQSPLALANHQSFISPQKLKLMSLKQLQILASRLYAPQPVVPTSPFIYMQTDYLLKSSRYPLSLIWQELTRHYPQKSIQVNWLHGLRLNLPAGNELASQVFITGYYEVSEMHLLSRLIQPGMTVIDAGANWGIYSLLLAKLVTNTGQVIAIEPSSREYHRLNNHIKLNQLSQIQPVKVALSDFTGSAKLSIAKQGHEGHNTLGKFVYPDTQLDKTQSVNLQTLDKLATQLKLTQLDFIKLDIEGSESLALSGGASVINTFRPLILLEVFNQSLMQQQSSANQVWQFLLDHNYQLYRFHPVTGLLIKADTPTQHQSENILAVPKLSSWNKLIQPLCHRHSNLPLVSIITPSYNSGKYIESCLQSVIRQDYPYVEHIIQDGASTDKTTAIIKKYASQYPNKICWSSEPDKGQPDGLNKAIQASRGDIILVLNSDDVLLPHACSWAVNQLRQHPECAVIYGDEYIINEAGQIIDYYMPLSPYSFDRLFCVELVPPAQAAFIRRSMFESVGFYADTSLATCPDYEMWVRLGMKFPFRHVPGPICQYRHHPESEGQKPELIDAMVAAKLKVINRVLSDRHTPVAVTRLKFRAYAGLYHWAADMAAGLTATNKQLYYQTKSFFSRPQIASLKQLFTAGSHYLRRQIITIYHQSLHQFFIALPKFIQIWLRKFKKTYLHR